MENASKALIIAGAILISILLIGVGVLVMNQINKPVSQAGATADSQAVEIFNSKFTPYLGANQPYATAKQALTAVNSVKKEKNISLSGSVTKASDLRSSNTYAIDATYADDGYINAISISADG